MISVSNQPSVAADSETRIDLTPMIDVIFTVIAFMMIIINVPLQTLDFDLPNTEDHSASTHTDPVILRVNDEPASWQIGEGVSGDAEATLSRLKALQAEAEDPLAIIVFIRKDAPVQRIVETFDLLQKGRFDQVSIATEELDASSGARGLPEK